LVTPSRLPSLANCSNCLDCQLMHDTGRVSLLAIIHRRSRATPACGWNSACLLRSQCHAIALEFGNTVQLLVPRRLEHRIGFLHAGLGNDSLDNRQSLDIILLLNQQITCLIARYTEVQRVSFVGPQTRTATITPV